MIRVKTNNNKRGEIKMNKVIKEETNVDFCEGFTITENGVNSGLYWLDVIPFKNNKKDRGMSFVKVTNLSYSYVPEVSLKCGSEGLNISVDENELITEWVGMVIHSGNEVTKEGLEEWLGRYGGGIESINEDVMMDEKFNVYDFDFEIIPKEDIVKMVPEMKEYV